MWAGRLHAEGESRETCFLKPCEIFLRHRFRIRLGGDFPGGCSERVANRPKDVCEVRRGQERGRATSEKHGVRGCPRLEDVSRHLDFLHYRFGEAARAGSPAKV